MKNLQNYLFVALLGFGCGRVDKKNGYIPNCLINLFNRDIDDFNVKDKIYESVKKENKEFTFPNKTKLINIGEQHNIPEKDRVVDVVVKQHEEGDIIFIESNKEEIQKYFDQKSDFFEICKAYNIHEILSTFRDQNNEHERLFGFNERSENPEWLNKKISLALATYSQDLSYQIQFIYDTMFNYHVNPVMFQYFSIEMLKYSMENNGSIFSKLKKYNLTLHDKDLKIIHEIARKKLIEKYCRYIARHEKGVKKLLANALIEEPNLNQK